MSTQHGLGFPAEPGELPFGIPPRIALEKHDRLFSRQVPEKMLNKLFISQPLHGNEIRTIPLVHQGPDLRLKPFSEHLVDPLLYPGVQFRSAPDQEEQPEAVRPILKSVFVAGNPKVSGHGGNTPPAP